MSTKISINIVTYNGQKWLAKCLDSVMVQSFKDFEFVIIDNGSKDGTQDLLRQYFADKSIKYSLIFNEENFGFAKGHNQAINASTSEYVLCLNQDIILEKDYLGKLVEFMDRKQEAGAVSGKLLVWDDQHDEKTDIIDSQGLELKKSWQVVENGSGEVDPKKKLEPEEIFGVSAAACLYRKKALKQIEFDNQYFDELFFSYKEDVDLSFRLNKKSWSSWLIPRAKGYHVRTAFYRGQGSHLDIAKARQQKDKRVNYWSYRNHWYLLIKHLDWPAFKKNFAWIIPYEFKKFIYVLLFEQGSLKALRDIVKNWKKLRITKYEIKIDRRKNNS